MKTKQKKSRKTPVKKAKRILAGAKSQMAMPIEVDVSFTDVKEVRDGQ